jgi:hypothetical protein
VTIASYSPAGTDAATSTPTASTATPPVPTTSAGAGAAPTGSTTALDPKIASKPLPGASPVNASPATPGTPATPESDEQIVQELANELGVKAGKGKTLDVAVTEALADQYGVKIPKPTQTKDTGTGQGEAGQIRHNIASWFGTALGGSKGSDVPQQEQMQREDAMKIKSPKLREQALKKVTENEQQDEGTPPGEAVPVESKKALQGMLTKVADKLGVQGAGPISLQTIAQGEGLATTTGGTAGTPATPGGAQTAGDAYQTFVKELADPKTATAFAAKQVPALEAAGLLDKNETGGTKQSNGTAYTNGQIATAYQSVLQQQVTKNQSESDALAALASNTTSPSNPTSEAEAYVEGIAQEFGVGLDQQQLTTIANQYWTSGTSAGTAPTDQIKDAVLALYDPTNPNNPDGVADTMYTDIQQAALQYQIPISNTQIGNMVKTALQGATVESMYVAADSAESAAVKQFQEQAQGLYPALSSQIQAGQTVQNLVAPYFNVAEAYTGVPAATMMADQQTGGPSKWAAFLQGGTNPSGSTQTAPGTTDKTGGPQMMTLDQWKTELMQNPTYGFQNTQGAKDMAEQMTSAILNEFGKVNTNGGSSQPFGAYNGAQDLSANTS